jgi:hypothetical protein
MHIALTHINIYISKSLKLLPVAVFGRKPQYAKSTITESAAENKEGIASSGLWTNMTH